MKTTERRTTIEGTNSQDICSRGNTQKTESPGKSRRPEETHEHMYKERQACTPKNKQGDIRTSCAHPALEKTCTLDTQLGKSRGNAGPNGHLCASGFLQYLHGLTAHMLILSNLNCMYAPPSFEKSRALQNEKVPAHASQWNRSENALQRKHVAAGILVQMPLTWKRTKRAEGLPVF